MLDLSEKLISFNQAGQFLPQDCRPSSATWWRWSRRGIGGIKLETAVIGGKRYTTQAALQRFMAARTAATDGAPIPQRTPRQRQRDAQRAERELIREGILSPHCEPQACESAAIEMNIRRGSRTAVE